MTYRLNNRPRFDKDYSMAYNVQRYNNWLAGFEKRQRWFLNPANMGSWLRENSDAETIGELLGRFIRNEILGEDSS